MIQHMVEDNTYYVMILYLKSIIYFCYMFSSSIAKFTPNINFFFSFLLSSFL